MNYMDIKKMDVANGPGVRLSLFVSGCPHKCPDCFNAESWPYTAGQPYTKATESYICELLETGDYDGFSILGGEPLDPANIGTVADLVERAYDILGENIWVWTGYTIEDLTWSPELKRILQHIDVLIDGPYKRELYNLRLQYCGSSNQRLIDCCRSPYVINLCLGEPSGGLYVYDQYDYKRHELRRLEEDPID